MIIKYRFQAAVSTWNAISRQLNYLQRLIGTMICYSLFSVGGLVLFLTIFQATRLFCKDKRKSQIIVRTIISCTFRVFLKMLNILGLIKTEVYGLENLSKLKGKLIVANHPCLLDVVVIMAYLNNIQCIVKHELWKSYFLGGVMRSAGYICNNRDPLELLEVCKDELNKGQNILIFPEGTRTTAGEPVKLQRGFGNLALAANADIQSLMINCEPLILTKQDKWYKIASKKVNLKVRLGQLFNISEYQNEKTRAIRVRRLISDVQNYYMRRLSYE